MERVPVVTLELAREPKVGELHLPAVVEQYVAAFDVAVNEVAAVTIVDGEHDLFGKSTYVNLL